jgi:hypothetical protein
MRSKREDKEVFIQFSVSLRKFGYPNSLMLPCTHVLCVAEDSGDLALERVYTLKRRSRFDFT